MSGLLTHAILVCKLSSTAVEGHLNAATVVAQRNLAPINHGVDHCTEKPELE